MGFSFRKASRPGPEKWEKIESEGGKPAENPAESRVKAPAPVSAREWESTLKATEALLAAEIGKSEQSLRGAIGDAIGEIGGAIGTRIEASSQDIRDTVLRASGEQRTEIQSIIQIIDQRTIDRAELNERRREAWKVISDSLAGLRGEITQLACGLKDAGPAGMPFEQLEGMIAEIRGEGKASAERIEMALSDLRDAQWARIEEMLGELRQAENERVERALAALKEEGERRVSELRQEGERRVSDVKQEGDKRVAALLEDGERKLAVVVQESDKRAAAVREEAERRAADLHSEIERTVAALQAEGEKRLDAVRQETGRLLEALQQESGSRLSELRDAGDLRVFDAIRAGDERVAAQRELLRTRLAELETHYQDRFAHLDADYRERIGTLNRDRENDRRENRRHRREALMHLIALLDSVDAQLEEATARLEAKEKQRPLEASPWPSEDVERKSTILGRLFGKEEIRRLETEREAREALAERVQRLDAELLESLRTRKAALESFRRLVMAALDREGVQPISSIGELFRPDRHQKVEEVVLKNGRQPGTVISERRRGFALNGEVLRPAEVAVVKSPN